MFALARHLACSADFRAMVFFALWSPLYFFPAALGQQVFFTGDIPVLFYPTRWELAQRLTQGELPLWSVYMQAGFPLLAEGHIGAFYLPNLILYRFFPIHLALAYSILFPLVWSGIGMYLFARAFRSHAVAMWENTSYLPRAYVVHQAEVVSDDAALKRMWSGDFQPEQSVFLDAGVSMRASPSVDTAHESVSIVEYKPERVVLNVHTKSDGYLVLADSWHPGWNAAVNGNAVRVYRANSIFRAVRVEPGDHHVVFEFRPGSLLWGAGISVASVMIMAGIVVAAWHNSKFLKPFHIHYKDRRTADLDFNWLREI